MQQKSGVCLIRSVAASFSKETTFATTRTTTATHAVTLCSPAFAKIPNKEFRQACELCWPIPMGAKVFRFAAAWVG